MHMEGQAEFNFKETLTCPHGVTLNGGERCEECLAEDHDDLAETYPWKKPNSSREAGPAENPEPQPVDFKEVIEKANPNLADKLKEAPPLNEEAWRNRAIRDGSGKQVGDLPFGKRRQERRQG